jgi:hypothetical protein
MPQTQHSGIDSMMSHIANPDVSMTELMGQVGGILEMAGVEARDMERPFSYLKDDYHCDRNEYKVKDHHTTKTRNREHPTDMEKIAASLGCVEELIHTLPPDLQSDSSRKLALSLTKIRTEELYKTWAIQKGLTVRAHRKARDPDKLGQNVPSARKAANRLLHKRRMARSRYRDRIRTTLCDLLEVIVEWVKQVKMPKINLQRRWDLEQVCGEIAKTCELIQKRFEETMPWANPV